MADHEPTRAAAAASINPHQTVPTRGPNSARPRRRRPQGNWNSEMTQKSISDTKHWLRTARTITEALPFLRRYNGKTFVIKYGGHAMVDDELRAQVAVDLVREPGGSYRVDLGERDARHPVGPGHIGRVGRALDLMYQYHELTSDRYYDTFTIEDDVAEVTLEMTDPEATEAGPTPATLVVRRTDNGRVQNALVVRLTGNGTATWFTDWTASGGSFSAFNATTFQMVIPPNQLSDRKSVV